MTRIKVSKMSAEDINDVLRLEEETDISRWTAESYLSEITGKNSAALSIKYDGELCGFLIARLIIIESKTFYLV